MSRICATCLSMDRNLVPVTMLKFELQNILNCIFYDFSFDMNNKAMCWECQAVLLKCEKFRRQVFAAQNIMTNCNTFSSLTISHKDDFDAIWTYDEQNIKVKNEFVEISILSVKPDICDEDSFPESRSETDDAEERDDNLAEIRKASKKRTKQKASHKEEKRKSSRKQTVKKKEKRVVKVSTAIENNERFTATTITLDQINKFREEDMKRARYVASRFKCTDCIKGFFSEEKLNSHNKIWHKESRHLVCPICRARYAFDASYKTHYEAHFKHFQCKMCSFSNYKMETVLSHYEKVHTTDFTCKICNEDFGTHNRLSYHKYKMHSKTPTSKCTICNLVLSTNSALNLHMRRHKDTKVKCEHCGKKVSSLHYKLHLKTHQDLATDKAYCVECGVQYKSELYYKKHLITSKRHALDKLRFTCDYCQGRYVNKTSLTQHILAVHMKIYPYKCHICGRGFVRKSPLRQHIEKNHQGIAKPKDKLCTYCGRGFSVKATLTAHLRTHTGEKPFKCELCPWSFKQKCALTTHIRGKHSNVRKLDQL